MNTPATSADRRVTPAGSLAIRGSIVHFMDDPGAGRAGACEHYEDGLLIVEGGYISKLGDARQLLRDAPRDLVVHDHSGKLILPGFVDAHVHFVQTDIVAAYGRRLLEWLEQYTFPAERAFADRAHAAEVAEFFLDELLRNGTTTALIMGSVHAQSADALFAAGAARNMRLVAGKVMMDRNCPEDLRDTPASSYADSKALIARWHGRDRLRYAITPRFAPTSSPEQLDLAGTLAREHPDVCVHTHVAENEEEVAWVQRLFPARRSYLDVYDHYGLLRAPAVLAHGIWLDARDRERLAERGAALCHCPTCNLFMGSGLFDLDAADVAGVRVGLGTDIGGGTTFSMLRVMHEAYKVAQLRGHLLSPLRAYYLATLAGARALGLDAHIGNFAAGKEADLVVLDPAATPLLQRRTARAHTLEERLFLLMMLGDDRAVAASYVMGAKVEGSLAAPPKASSRKPPP
jgi:guanine deaminase